jgi:hypothetical protein
MNTVRVEIEDEKDIPRLEKLLTDLGLKFHFESGADHSSVFSETAMVGINEGLKDMREGNVFGNMQARRRIDTKIAEMQQRNAGQ